MKQKTIATRHLRTKIAAGYVLILLLIFGIVYIWLNEQQRRQEIETTSNKIRCFRKDVHEVYVKVVDLSLIGETVLDWNEEEASGSGHSAQPVQVDLPQRTYRQCLPVAV